MPEKTTTLATTEATTEAASKGVTSEQAVETKIGETESLDTKQKMETSEPTEETPASIETDDLDGRDISEAKKPGWQKRIDKLTAKVYELTDKLEKYEGKKVEEEAEEKVYTEQELFKALKKGMEEGDQELVWEVMKTYNKQTVDALRKEYTNEQKRVAEQIKEQTTEWKYVKDNYSHLSDPDEPEIYKGSRQELDLNDNKSLLFRTATKLYNSEEPELRKRYNKLGGQELAVADALAKVLKRRKDKSPASSNKEDVLKRALDKERRKYSLTSPSTEKEETTEIRPQTENDKIEEYLSERKKFISERT